MRSVADHVTPPTAFPPRGPEKPRDSGLRALHRELTRGRCASELLEDTADLICNAVRVKDCTILEFQSETGKLCQRVARGWPDNYELSLDVQWSAHFDIVIDSGEPVLIHCRPDDLQAVLRPSPRKVISALLVPVLGGDSVIGVVGVFTGVSRDLWPSDLDFVKNLSDFIALVWQLEKTHCALRESQLKYELMVGGSDEVFFYSHNNYHIVQYASPSLQHVLGYTPEEVIGHLSEEFFLEDPSNEVAIELTDIALRSGVRQRPYRAVLRHKNGQKVILETTEAPIVHDGRVVGMQGFARDVTQVEESLRRGSLRLLEAQEEERRRISRDIHDSTGQTLAALTMNLGALANSCSSHFSRAERKRLEDSLHLAEECARELRTASYLLHPPLLEKAGLSSALKWYTAGFSSRSGIKVNLQIPPDLERVPRNVGVALFRIIQEALTNVHRHSQSSTARIRLKLDDNLVHLEISDRGIGLCDRPTDAKANIRPPGIGFTGMRERVRELGGDIQISSQRGTAIRAILPLSANA
jgi:two-component system, NarL family, sensor kinase